MNKISLSLKISFSFILASIVTLSFLYVAFYNLFEDRMIKVEEEKARLIASTIEPLMATSYFLNLEDDIKQLAERLSEHGQVAGLRVIIGGKTYWRKSAPIGEEYINVRYPITDSISSDIVGNIHIAYTKDALDEALRNIHSEILYYLGVLAFIFVLYVIFIRYLLSPFSEIAKKVKNYVLGSQIDFSSIRHEPEVDSIATAFESMISDIREHTVLLERYKHSVDESAIVVRMDIDGYVTYVNDEFCRLSGYSLEETLGVSIFVICHSEVDEDQMSEILETVRSKMIWKGNLQNGSKNNEIYYVRATVVPILDEQDNIIEFISIQQDITKVVKQQEQIVRQTMDHVTGLYNRVKLEEDIIHVDEPKFAIISLDNYNVIRDYYGIESGKDILNNIAGVILSITSLENISIYKLSGGEYAVLGNEAFDMDLFHAICRTLLKKINDYTMHLDDNVLHIGASAGLTSDKEHFLSYAGLALRHAQDTGHQMIIYEEEENLVQSFENNIAWTKKLNSALKDNRIVLYVQPIHDAKTLQIDKYECLVRMIDEDGKVISPYYFLDVAKKSKLYHQLTEQIMAIAFGVFSQVPDVRFSINFTLEDILHEATTQSLKEMLDETGLASRFTIEIVESEGIDNFKVVSDFVMDMKFRGCEIAIDDFGSGYSNFAYLMGLNVDYIKIDGSLIKAIDQDRNSQIITSTIMDFSQQLQIATVAEFVHNEAVLDYVQKLGIDYLQGFHLGEPVPIETLLNKSSSNNRSIHVLSEVRTKM